MCGVLRNRNKKLPPPHQWYIINYYISFQEIEMKILDESLGNLHKLEKKHFFALLDSNYLDSLEPIYE